MSSDGSYVTYHGPAEFTPCDHCASIPDERVRLVDIIDPASYGIVVSVRLCIACRRRLRGQLHNFDRGDIGPVPGMPRRKRNASEPTGFMARGSTRAMRVA